LIEESLSALPVDNSTRYSEFHRFKFSDKGFKKSQIIIQENLDDDNMFLVTQQNTSGISEGSILIDISKFNVQQKDKAKIIDIFIKGLQSDEQGKLSICQVEDEMRERTLMEMICA